MSKCVNVNHPDFLQLVEETGLNPIVLSAKMGVWMEKNDTDEWPSAQQLGIDSGTKYQLQTKKIDDVIVSEKTIRDVAARMADRIGIKVNFISDKTQEFRGKLKNREATINLAYATLDTPIHEILGHPIVKAIKNTDRIYKQYIVINNNTNEILEVDTEEEADVIADTKYAIGEDIIVIKSKYVNFLTPSGNKNDSEFEIYTQFDDHYRGGYEYTQHHESAEWISNGAFDALTKYNTSQLYNNLLSELEYGVGKSVLDRIKRDYIVKVGTVTTRRPRVPVKRGDNPLASIYTYSSTNRKGERQTFNTKEEAEQFATFAYTLADQQEEAIVELLGLMTAKKLDAVKDGKLISLLKRLLTKINNFVKELLEQKEINIYSLPTNLTIEDLANVLAYSNSKLILPGYEVKYTTPDNMSFNNYGEASKHISDLAKSVQEVDLSKISLIKELTDSEKKEIESLKSQIDYLEVKKLSKEYQDNKQNQINTLREELSSLDLVPKFDVYASETSVHVPGFDYGRVQNTWNRPGDHKDVLGDYEGYYIFGYTNGMGTEKYIKPITEEEARTLWENSEYKYVSPSISNRALNINNQIDRLEKDRDIEYEINNLKYKIEDLTNNNKEINEFIYTNKPYEQAKEIIERWKEVNQIQYNPEEVYNRGQGFYSVMGAYSDFDANLLLQNLLLHIEDNIKAGGEFTISAFTKPVDKNINHLDGGGGKIRFVIYPKPNDIKWATATDAYSGSVWDASKKVNKDKLSELLGVSYSKYPSLNTIYSNMIEPNLANIIDKLNYHHNELGISLNNNFRLEFDEDVPYTTKKIINGINNILNQKYGKLVKPVIKDNTRIIISKNEYQTAKEKGTVEKVVVPGYGGTESYIFNDAEYIKQDTSIDDIYYYKTLLVTRPDITNENLVATISDIQNELFDTRGGYDNKYGTDSVELTSKNNKTYEEQAIINIKVAAFKNIAKKYPRVLIRSEIIRMDGRPLTFADSVEGVDFQKIIGKPVTDQQINSQIGNLQKAFGNVGINIKVSSNSNIKEAGRVINGAIEYNPNKFREDSIFHEHGHILVDLVADRDFINSGIDQLRGTKLWNDIATLYSEYDDTQLGKEVLTTAIGLNARDQFNDTQLPLWKFWYNRFMDRVVAILNQLGILHSPVEGKDYEKPIAIELARQLTNGNITIRLNTKLKIHNNQLRDTTALKYLENFDKYLTSTKNNAQRTIIRGKHSKSAYIDRAEERYEITKLVGAVNLTNATDVFNVTTKQLENDITDLGALEKRADELKTDYLDKDVKLKDLSDKDRQHFFQSLIGLSKFISGYTPIREFGVLKDKELDDITGTGTLPQSDTDEYRKINQFILDTQKEMLPRIAALEDAYRDLIPLVTEDLLKYSTNKEVTKNLSEYAQNVNNGTFDESTIQLLFDALVYSNNPIASNMAKTLHLEDNLAVSEAERIVRKYWKARTALSEYKDTQLADMIYDKNGQLVQQFDVIKFNQDLEVELSKYKEGSIKYKAAKIKFYQENTEFKTKPDGTKYTVAEINEIGIKKKEELNAADYNYWLDKQIYTSNIENDNNVYYKHTGDFVQLVGKYTNPVYTNLMNDQRLSNYYNAVSEMMKEATSVYYDSPQNKGALPAIANNPKDYGIEHGESVDIVDADGNIHYILPIKYIGLIGAEATYTYDNYSEEKYGDWNTYTKEVIKKLERTGKATVGQFTTIKDIKDANKKIVEENKIKHGQAVNKHLDVVLPLFVESAIKYKHRKKIEDELNLSLAILKNQKVKKLTKMGNTRKSTNTDKDGNLEDSTFSGAQSNTYVHAQKFLKMVFYDKYVTEARGDELLKALKDYTSILGMWGNVFAAVKNITMGGYMTAAEAAAGIHGDRASLAKGSARYLSGKLSYMADTKRKDGSASTLESAMRKKYKVIESYTDQFELNSPEISTAFAKKIFIDVGFFLQHEGEDMMQNTTMFMMLESHRLIDGKAMSFQDYLDGKTKRVLPKMNRVDADKIIAENAEIKKTAQEKFDTYPQMKDIYELSEEGFAEIKAEYKDQFSEVDEALFKEEIKGVNHKIHGIYNKSHKGTANEKMWVQSLMQFRNWVRPGWNKRFGTRGGIFSDQPFWNENRNEVDTGTYSSLLKLIAMPITQNNKKNWSGDQERNAFIAAQSIIKDYGDWLVNMKYYWHQMSDAEKAAAKSAMTELLILAALMLMSTLLRGLFKDKDWAKKNRYVNFLLYQISASITEMWTFVPVYGWLMEGSKILTNPNATYGFALNSFKLVNAAFQYPFIDDEKRYFKGGVNNNKLKVQVYLSRDLPISNVYQRIMQLDTQNKAYNMFGAVGGSSNN